MRSRRIILKLGAAGLATGALSLIGACAAGVSQSDYDATKQQLASEEQKASALQQQLSAKQKEYTDLQQKLAEKEKEVTEAQKEAAEQPKAASDGVTTLIGVKPEPTRAPAPPPTPLPAGATPPPKPTPPPSVYETVGPYHVYVEVLATTTPSKFGLASTVACTPSSVFKRGQKMVWRFEVIDTATGKRVTDKDEAALKVLLPHGEDITARWSARGGGRVPGAPWMWSAAWDIPLDYPIGGVDYAITITKGGGTVTWKPPSLVTADGSTDTRPKIIA